jgi:amidase
LQSPFPFYFPEEASAETPDLFPMPACSGITLEEATIDQLQDAIGKGELTAVGLVGCYLRRILQVDGYIR